MAPSRGSDGRRKRALIRAAMASGSVLGLGAVAVAGADVADVQPETSEDGSGLPSTARVVALDLEGSSVRVRADRSLLADRMDAADAGSAADALSADTGTPDTASPDTADTATADTAEDSPDGSGS